jgi:glycosyltransferase involved in cell wall biosynthesis
MSVKILHFISTNSYHPYFTDLARHLKGPDIRLYVGSLLGRGDLHRAVESEGVETLALDCKSRRNFPRATLRLAHWLREKQIDVVHAHLSDSAAVGLSAARLARVPGRVMTRHHSDERLVYQSHKAVFLDRFISRYLAKHVVAISNPVKQAFIEIDKVDEAKIRMVPNGYDWNRVQSTPEASSRVRRELGIEGCIVLCHVGRIVWSNTQNAFMKGQDQLLRAFAAAGMPAHARVLIVGGGPQDGLRALADNLRIGHQCLFLGHRQDIFDVMAASDLMVHPSLSEAQCHVLIEAMALGKSIIASTVGAAEEMIIPGENGWLVPSQDHVALVAALCEAVSDPERLRLYGEAGQKFICGLYPIERMIQGYKAIYHEELLGRAMPVAA